MTEIQAPTHCPSCNSSLEWSNHLLYCRNSICDSQSAKKLEHFAKTLKIKGLGPASISKLGLTSLEEIYTLDLATLCERLSSEKLGKKLLEEIENSKKVSLETLLPAFSIPLIGKTAAEKLSKVCNGIEDIDYDSCAAAGLGQKASENLIHWLEEDFFSWYDGMLPFTFKFSKASSITTVTPKATVCISGKLNSYKTKAEAAKVLSDLGYTVKSSLTKDVEILVNESGIESSKTQKARESGVQIIENLKTFILENI
jgi:DNA ligase (NAD+)